MLYAVAGSQGAGKSTVLSALTEKGYPSISRKTSRSILSDWGVSLSEVNNSRPLTIKFQDEILSRKFDDEQEAASSKDIWFTERTYMDLFTYALVAVGKDNEYSDWIDDYYFRCLEKQEYYNHIFFLPGGKFAPVHDGVRGSNQHYQRMVDMTLQYYTRLGNDHLVTEITEVLPESRVKQIVDHVEQSHSFLSDANEE